MVAVALSPDWIEVISDCRLPLRNPESSHDNDPTSRLLWNNSTAEDTCFSVLKWGFNELQGNVYGIKLDVMHEFHYPPAQTLWLDKIELSTDDVNYVEVWSGHKPFSDDGSLTFEMQSMKSAILSFSMDWGTRCGIAEIYFVKLHEEGKATITRIVKPSVFTPGKAFGIATDVRNDGGNADLFIRITNTNTGGIIAEHVLYVPSGRTEDWVASVTLTQTTDFHGKIEAGHIE